MGTAKVQLAEFVKGGSKEITVPLADCNKRELQVFNVTLKIINNCGSTRTGQIIF